jgi:hypothetical protein
VSAHPSVTLSFDGSGTDQPKAPEHGDALRHVLSAAVCLAGIIDAKTARRMAMRDLERALATLKALEGA